MSDVDEGMTHSYGDGCVPPHIQPMEQDPNWAGKPHWYSETPPRLNNMVQENLEYARRYKDAQEHLRTTDAPVEWLEDTDTGLDSEIDLARSLLQSTTGLDPNTEHGAQTPKRFVSMLKELTTREPFNFTVFANTENVDEMVTVTDLPFYTLCQHHVIPFYGKCHIAYIPDGSVAGLSKFGRAVKYLARGLWVQEHLTIEIADFLEHRLQPKGIAVVMKAEHLCMAMRGVQMPGALTTTSCMRGVFSDHDRTAKAEFMSLIP